MVEKSISSYGDLESQSPFNSDKLIVNIGLTYICFIVKLQGRGDISAFELFQFEKATDNWYDIFHSAKTQSKILDRSYNNTEVFYNTPEVVLMPSDKYSSESADSFLTTVFGKNFNQVIHADAVNMNESVMNAYRIKRSLFDIVRSNFMMVETKHYYSKVLENLLKNNQLGQGIFLRLEFYHNFFLLVLINHNQLQLIQQYAYSSADDMLYYIIGVLEQYRFKPENIEVVVAGFMDTKTQDYDYLRKLFVHIRLESLNKDLAQKELIENYPAHYLSTFFKTVV